MNPIIEKRNACIEVLQAHAASVEAQLSSNQTPENPREILRALVYTSVQSLELLENEDFRDHARALREAIEFSNHREFLCETTLAGTTGTPPDDVFRLLELSAMAWLCPDAPECEARVSVYMSQMKSSPAQYAHLSESAQIWFDVLDIDPEHAGYQLLDAVITAGEQRVEHNYSLLSSWKDHFQGIRMDICAAIDQMTATPMPAFAETASVKPPEQRFLLLQNDHDEVSLIARKEGLLVEWLGSEAIVDSKSAIFCGADETKLKVEFESADQMRWWLTAPARAGAKLRLMLGSRLLEVSFDASQDT